MLQKYLLFNLLAVCAAMAFFLPATAHSQRNTGSRSRSEPDRGRAVGQDVSINPTAGILLITPQVEESVEVGLLGTAWLTKSIAHSFMELAGQVASSAATFTQIEPAGNTEVEPTKEIEPVVVEATETATVATQEPVELPATPAGLEPAPRPERPAFTIPTDIVPPPPAVEEELPDPVPAEPEPADPVLSEPEPVMPGLPTPEPAPVEPETPSRFELRTGDEWAETNLPILSELMAKLEKLDSPTDGSTEAGEGQEKWRNDESRETEGQTVGLNSSAAVAFLAPAGEALISPGIGSGVDYPDNPNANLVDGEIARLSPGSGAGNLGQANPRVFALAALSPSPEFGQAMVLSPLSSSGIGALTSTVRSVDPANMAFNRATPAMPNPMVSTRIRSISRGNSKQMKIALTFDDGPHPAFTNKILAILDFYGVEATFFYVGLQAKKYPQWVKMTHQAGHEIASQTYDHFRLPKLPLEEKQYQIDEYQRLIENTIGVTPRFMRPPGGQLDDVTKRLLSERGMVLALWDVALNDTREGKTAADMLKTARNQVRPGSILLVHDGIEATIEVLPELIEYLQAQGYEFVTMSELAQGS